MDSYFVVAGAQHPWTRRRRISPAELMKGVWVLPPPDTPPGSIAKGAFRAAGLDYPPTTVFAVSPDARMSLLATGRYLTISASSACDSPPAVWSSRSCRSRCLWRASPSAL